jgi:hypothetical protein
MSIALVEPNSVGQADTNVIASWFPPFDGGGSLLGRLSGVEAQAAAGAPERRTPP